MHGGHGWAKSFHEDPNIPRHLGALAFMPLSRHCGWGPPGSPAPGAGETFWQPSLPLSSLEP